MLEKLGLPPKPSARGRSWVIDASNCQQCASQFSIFNRKHHCRRCGGLFCGNCVQSRMILRGQGDSPVRICEPCKQLELATRFEARHGRKKKDEASLEQDELLIKSLLNEEAHESSSSSAVEPVTPESLRTKAQNEKEKATALRKEGKTEEATKAYKRSKELEKQADTLALALRKNSKKPAPSPSSFRELEVTTQTLQKVSTEKKKPAGDEDLLKELKDLGWSEPDLSTKQASDAEILREGGGQKSGKAGALQMEILGHKRRALALKREGKLAEAKEELRLAKTLEKRLEEIETLGEDDEDDEEDGDELSSVLKALEKEIDHHQPAKPVQLTPESLPVIRDDEDDDQVDVSEKDMSDPEMLAALKAMGWAEESRVLERLSSHREEHLSKQELQAKILSHKRSALALKRAGNLVEARRELAEAKALERTLGASSEAEVLVQEPENVEVTEHDMRDPEMMAALRALGFGGDDQELVDGVRVKDEEKQSLQREALDARRASEAALKRGSLRKEAEEGVMSLGFDDQPVKLKFDPRVRTKAPSISDDDEEEDVMSFVKDLSRDSEVAAMLQGLSLDEKNEQAPAPAPAPTTRKVSKKRVVTPVELPNRSKRELQQELLGKKRLALSLRREGKEEEAERVMKEASALELQMKALEEAEKNQTQPQPQSLETDEDDDDEEENDEVTEDDLMDPTLLAALSAIGFKDEAAEAGMVSKAVTKKIVQKAPPEEVKVDEDDAAGFEGEYGEIGQVVDVPSGFIHPFFSRFSGSSSENKQKQTQAQAPAQAQVQQVQAPVSNQAQAQQVQAKQQVQSLQKPAQAQVQAQIPPSKQAQQEQVLSSSSSVEQQILELKRTALRMKKSGDLAGAKEELRKAKLLENSQQQQIKTITTTTETKVVVKEEPKVEKKKAESTFKDRMKLQRESLAHKRKALTLRREGKAEEAEAEFELAKSLERQMEELEAPVAGALDEGVEDVIDSQLAGALAGLGFEFPSSASSQPKIPPKITPAPIQSSSKITQAPQLESSVQEKIRSLRLRALELKRSGKQQEALQALREAKRLEKGS